MSWRSPPAPPHLFFPWEDWAWRQQLLMKGLLTMRDCPEMFLVLPETWIEKGEGWGRGGGWVLVSEASGEVD